MRPLFSPETRRRLQENDPKWQVKAILQLVCTVLAFNALILFADATAITNRYYVTAYHDWTDWMPLFPVRCHSSIQFFILASILPYGHLPRGSKLTLCFPLGPHLSNLQPRHLLPAPAPPRQASTSWLARGIPLPHLGPRHSFHRLLRRLWLVLVVATGPIPISQRTYPLPRLQLLVRAMPTGHLHHRQDRDCSKRLLGPTDVRASCLSATPR